MALIGLHHIADHSQTQPWMYGTCPHRSTPPAPAHCRYPLLRESAWSQEALLRQQTPGARTHRRAHGACRAESGSDPFSDAGTLRHTA